MRQPFFLIGVALAITTAAGSARAETNAEDEQPQPKAETARDLSVRMGAGVFAGPTVGTNLELEALGRSGMFAFGATGTIGNALFDYTYVGVGPTAGISLALPRWARIDLLGTVGTHSYTHVRKGFLSSDPGTDGTLAFVGARAHLGVEFGGPAFRLGVGLRPYFETDLGRIERTYSYDETFFVNRRQTVTHTIGTQRSGVALALVGTFGL